MQNYAPVFDKKATEPLPAVMPLPNWGAVSIIMMTEKQGPRP